ncbi:hypothetical protein AJ79_10347 [Helicocarpus griseus UAMH5409]|uniref:Chromo domain-containing protein n=1 Tax=Helicocarpus griseus UAMH5409 TaxID=1447875 RepID=A0A2B7WEQ1_9EURO|nr:hypothetical protein AJ79_10347 [Helicocarpus griseus UAMH5409]
MKGAQKQQQKQANKRRRELDFNVGDMVYVRINWWNTGHSSKKLDNQMSEPWPIIERIGNSFKVALSDSVKVHPVFSPDKLHRAMKDPLPEQTLDEKPPIEVDGQLKYTVNCILASQVHYGKLKYRVDWLGYDDDPEWYPASNFKNSPAKLHEFHECHPEASGPLVNLAY